MDTVDTIRVQTHDELLEIQAKHRIIFSIKFKVAFERSSETERKIFKSLKTARDMRKWIDKHSDLDNMHFVDLRDLARLENIRYYSKLNRRELIAVLKGKKNGTTVA